MPSYASLLFAALAAVPALVSAHGHVVSISVNGAEISGSSVGWATTVTDNGFVAGASANSADIVCHRGATSARNSATVAAGSSISIKWDTWPKSHVGPIIDYLAPCANGDCSSVDKTSLQFFKIKQGGLIDGSSAPGLWVTDKFIDDGFTWTTTIPASLAPGSYVLRHEIVALHEGDRLNGVQYYPQCINLRVTGTGTLRPAGVVATSLYTATDPGIFFDVYRSNSNYPIPGPRLAIGGGSPAPAPTTLVTATARPTAVATSTRAPAAVTTTRAATVPTTTRAATAPTQPATGGQPLYAQCGGQNFTGGKTCARGICTKLNDYYSQCVPN